VDSAPDGRNAAWSFSWTELSLPKVDPPAPLIASQAAIMTTIASGRHQVFFVEFMDLSTHARAEHSGRVSLTAWKF
jgi:hypothetical protein